MASIRRRRELSGRAEEIEGLTFIELCPVLSIIGIVILIAGGMGG